MLCGPKYSNSCMIHENYFSASLFLLVASCAALGTKSSSPLVTAALVSFIGGEACDGCDGADVEDCGGSEDSEGEADVARGAWAEPPSMSRGFPSSSTSSESSAP